MCSRNTSYLVETQNNWCCLILKHQLCEGGLFSSHPLSFTDSFSLVVLNIMHSVTEKERLEYEKFLQEQEEIARKEEVCFIQPLSFIK